METSCQQLAFICQVCDSAPLEVDPPVPVEPLETATPDDILTVTPHENPDPDPPSLSALQFLIYRNCGQ